MTIGFVHAGILTFIQGLSMIMGASVGNTFVAWIMAAEFNYAISYYIFPLFFVALWLVKLRDYRSLGESIFGLCFMFLGLRLLYEFTDDLQLTSSPVLSAIFGSLSDNYGSYLILLLCGGVFTLCFQSSAALMAASMILCSTGIISIYSGIALVLGENIGRGLITYYAASSANLTARRTAMAQLIFNLFGVLWVFWIFPYFIETVCNTMGYQTTGRLEEHTLTYVLAAFHTCFNLCNVALFIWFIKPIERLVNNIVPKNDEENEDTNELRYITGGLLATPELSVLEAQKEINGFAEMTCRMFTQVRYLITINNTVEFRQIYMKIRKLEDASDALEEEIADYLGEVSDDLLSSDTKNQIRCMLREVSELESIADSCYILSHIISTKYHGKQLFTSKQLDHLHQLFQLTDQALQEMKRILSIALAGALCASALAACSGSSSSTAASSAPAASSEAASSQAASSEAAEAAPVENGLQIGQSYTATSDYDYFTYAVAVVQGDTIVAAYLDDFQFFDTADGADIVGVPNSDADFGADYAEGKVLGSKRENDAYYYVSRPSAHVGWTGLSFLTGCL